MASRKKSTPHPHPKRAVALIRVSTAKQVLTGASLDAQDARVRAHCIAAGLELVEVLPEEGVSAGKPLAQRAVGQALLQMIAERRVNHVVVYKLDRLFRNVQDCLHHVSEWDAVGIGLHIVDMGGQAIDTKTAMGKMFLVMNAGFAELERNLISERTRMGMQEKARQGVLIGSIPYGHTRAADPTRGSGVSNRDTVEVPRELLVLAHMQALAATGLTVRAIALELNRARIPPPRADARAWAPSTVHRILKSMPATGPTH